jgi:hypothetical protein
MMIHKSPFIIEIPIDWTAAQADAVFEFLSILATAVWDAYDNQLTEIAQAQALSSRINESVSGDDDDYPF